MLAGALTMALAGCGGGGGGDNVTSGGGGTGASSGTFFGTAQTVGGGTARAFITRSGDTPTSVGVEFSAAALSGLSGAAREFKLPVPAELASSSFKGISLDFSPGHTSQVPAGFLAGFPVQDIANQNVPLLKPTFYLFTDQERQQIRPNSSGANARVAEPELPGNFISTGVTTATQGTGYYQPYLTAYSPTSVFVPVRRPFDAATYQYLFWNGHMDAIQLAAANSFLARRQDQGDQVVQPQKFSTAGFYPTHYTVHFDASRNVYTMALDRFIRVDTGVSDRGSLPNLEASGGTTTYGAAQVVGQGLMRAYATRNGSDTTAVGIEFDPNARRGLPLVADTFPQDYPLPAPSGLAGTGFKSVSMIWMPGPIPPYAQKVGFFQSNFWFITRDQRYQIFPFDLPPHLLSPEKVPVGTIPSPGPNGPSPPVPFEGQIYFNPRDPNWGLPGNPPPTFRTTRFNYVAFMRNVVGVEVSATMNNVLANKLEVTMPLFQPHSFPASPFPTRYHVKFHPALGVYTVAVEGFEQH